MEHAKRSEAYGVLGAHLLAILQEHPTVIDQFHGLTFTQSLIRLQGFGHTLRSLGPLLPHAVSLLLLDFPMHTTVTPSELYALVRHAFDFTGLGEDALVDPSVLPDDSPVLKWSRRGYHRKLGNALICDSSLRKALFPKKPHAAAGVKINVTLGRLVSAWAHEFGPASVGRHLAALAGRVSDDQACCALLYAATLAPAIQGRSVATAQAAILQPDNAKGLSNALKALGANATMPGALFTEANVLQGRFTMGVDMSAEIRSRTVQSEVDRQVIDKAEVLREHVRALLEQALPSDCSLPDLDDWWTSRWLWCVNGSETARSDRALGLHRGQKRRYRRMASEEVANNPVPTWDGTTSVSASIKLEPGKDRAIFACDTPSYFAFSWILNDVQKRWKGERIILDPGTGGLCGISRRVRGAQRGGGVNVMLDYDNFNSHHSTAVQQMVFEELCDRYNAPAWYKQTLVASFDKMYIHDKGVKHRVLGTMMSGHRGTTFINSVLNAAYIRCALGAHHFDRMISLHAGDDVYIRANTLAEAAHILDACKAFGCRMNPTKQSIGFRNAEFLRLGINQFYAVGYVTRTIATLVAGNWANLDPLMPLEALTSVIGSVRSVLNRGAPKVVADLVARTHATLHGLPLPCIKSILRGESAIAGSPVYTAGTKLRTWDAVVEGTDDKGETQPHWGRNATLSYLGNHVQPIEARAIELSKTDLVSLMLKSSYAKEIRSGELQTPKRVRVRLIARAPEQANGYAEVSTLLTERKRRGVLENYPLIRLLENRLSDTDLVELAASLGVVCRANDAREVCFGAESLTHNILGTIPYSDASSLSKLTTSRNLIVTYQVCA
ncbi:RNA-dependent RNA polymerase [Stagonosporopsis cucurbitacearum victorivirus 1]|nr:RNA-dependent RNA polymerase [Stagonosporopsis cucurbitacearum victorivirus 1]